MTRGKALVLIAALAATLVAIVIIARLDGGLPAPGSPAYEAVTRAFSRGVAGLHVGLLDGARTEFLSAVSQVPGEPASWANLGITQLRLGDLDAAVVSVERAASLAPDRADIALLVARTELVRGRVDEGVAALRRAVALDARSVRARFALAEETERAAGPDADADAAQLLDELQALAPDNVLVALEQVRLAAKRGDTARLGAAIARLGPLSSGWSALAVEQLRTLQAAGAVPDFAGSARAVTFLRNALTPSPQYQDDLLAVRAPAETFAEPFEQYLRLTPLSSSPSPPDIALRWLSQPIAASTMTGVTSMLVLPLDGVTPAMLATDGRDVIRLDDSSAIASFPGGASAAVAGAGLAALDWNHDFRMDVVLAGPGGVRLLTQGADGVAFTDVTPAAAPGGAPAPYDAVGAWAADLEMDGDIDIVVGLRGAAPLGLRNNGDGTWLEIRPFAGALGIQSFVWADLDRDGDPDAGMLDAQGDLHIFANRQAGAFERLQPPVDRGDVVALAAGDPDANGTIDVVSLDATGAVWRSSWQNGSWDAALLARWNGFPAGTSGNAYRLLLADLDNNGGIDLVASAGGRSAVWLGGQDGVLQPMAIPLAADVIGAADWNGDGLLDLAAIEAGVPVRLIAQGAAGYHWQVIRARAQQDAGDQRINSFGVGGELDVRSGLLVQKHILTGAPVHVGLGTRTAVDVVRIVWPNGVMQAEFDPAVDGTMVADQRLKGSCPWVFAYDGSGMRFVTDFLWRSPLGLRINAQDTAGITQTEDWVRIRGDQLAPRDGVYDIRITAELWETHFIDHVALLAIDHPADTDVFVDERFSRTPPALEVRALRGQRPVGRAWDDGGRDVTAAVAAQDGNYLATFERGAYQGIAREHFVEFELDEPVSRLRPRTLVAYGWIYPTDSSINVAIGQGGGVAPRGLSLEAQDPSGGWVVVAPDLGFPAGKNKTVLIPLDPSPAGLASARRFRLRTNLEIYWDSLATADEAPGAPLRTVRLAAARSDLRFRGFSQTEYGSREVPETPSYDVVATISQRWRDLVGYYTRFGDVVELTAGVDDRYVIMNAGDELRLEFPALPPPPEGWRRDFVLVGDGWEKDGDYNTDHSKTVLPLPSHDRPVYGGPLASLELRDDPVYRRYPDDWSRYHTRFVTPRQFLHGLWTR